MARTIKSTNTGPDLFDVEAAEQSPEVVHMILPHFATACGLGFLEVSRMGHVKGFRMWTTCVQETTCPDCLARGDLSALCRQIMGNQAPTIDQQQG